MLLPKILQFRDEALSLPLGAAKVKPVAVKVDLISAFEKGNHGVWLDVHESVRELKRTIAEATPPSTEKPPKFKVGERFVVTHTGPHPYTGTQGVIRRLLCGGEALEATMDINGLSDIYWTAKDIAPVSPSEPKEADGWRAWGVGEPPEEGSTFIVKRDDGSLFGEAASRSIRKLWADACYFGWLVKQQ